MALDTRAREHHTRGKKPPTHQYPSIVRTPESSDAGLLPELLLDVVDVATSPDAAELLGQVVEGVGVVVSAIGDVAS